MQQLEEENASFSHRNPNPMGTNLGFCRCYQTIITRSINHKTVDFNIIKFTLFLFIKKKSLVHLTAGEKKEKEKKMKIKP